MNKFFKLIVVLGPNHSNFVDLKIQDSDEEISSPVQGIVVMKVAQGQLEKGLEIVSKLICEVNKEIQHNGVYLAAQKILDKVETFSQTPFVQS
ncbi:MAG: hypothetical protein V1707_00380 [bacterium]